MSQSAKTNGMKMIQEEKKIGDEHLDSHAHHTGILKAMLSKAVSDRFSSKPIEVKHRLQQAQQGLLDEVGTDSLREKSGDYGNTSSGCHPTLTRAEQAYLEELLKSEDHDSIRQATETLSDHGLFPRVDQEQRALAKLEENSEVPETNLTRRDSEVQRLLFRMHEIGRGPAGTEDSAPPKRRLRWNERKEGTTVLESQTSISSLLDDNRRGSILMRNSILMGQADNDNESDIVEQDWGVAAANSMRNASTTTDTTQDISSWLDGTRNEKPLKEGDEDNNEAMSSAKMAAESFFRTSFAILGTAADDASCHPHVLSPPLMESLLEFVPETLSDYHFWIKYSMVRDGANLYTLLRHARASTRTILAIETTDGAVFGAFTSSPWRFVKNIVQSADKEADNETSESADTESAFYGSQDSFLWKMRQSRFDSQRLVRSSTVEQAILMESELAVFPYTGRNNCVQHCGTEDGIGLGDNASALRLDASLRTGSSAASETFSNPCLIDPKEEVVEFQVANLEVWTLTPYDNVKDAEKAELSALFQQRQEEQSKQLDVFNILVSGPKT